MRNEILIAFWVTLLAMVVFGCLQEEAPASPIQENSDLSQPETEAETAEVVNELVVEEPVEAPVEDEIIE